MSGIYEIRNMINGKRYIGSAVNLNRRRSQHYSELAKDKHPNGILQAAWRKYGAGSFAFQVLLICSKNNLIFFEQQCLDGLHPEYNIARIAGSQLGYRHSHSLETRAKISASLKGRRKSDQMRIRLGNAHRGKTISPEARAKMSAAKKGRVLSMEVCASMSASTKARGPEWRRETIRRKNG